MLPPRLQHQRHLPDKLHGRRRVLYGDGLLQRFCLCEQEEQRADLFPGGGVFLEQLRRRLLLQHRLYRRVSSLQRRRQPRDLH